MVFIKMMNVSILELCLVLLHKKMKKMEQVFDGQGRFAGFELIDEIDFKEYAKEVAVSAVKQLDALDIKAGVMPVVIHNGFGGVLFHEACGHPLEASAIAKGFITICWKSWPKSSIRCSISL